MINIIEPIGKNKIFVQNKEKVLLKVREQTNRSRKDIKPFNNTGICLLHLTILDFIRKSSLIKKTKLNFKYSELDSAK